MEFPYFYGVLSEFSGPPGETSLDRHLPPPTEGRGLVLPWSSLEPTPDSFKLPLDLTGSSVPSLPPPGCPKRGPQTVPSLPRTQDDRPHLEGLPTVLQTSGVRFRSPSPHGRRSSDLFNLQGVVGTSVVPSMSTLLGVFGSCSLSEPYTSDGPGLPCPWDGGRMFSCL